MAQLAAGYPDTSSLSTVNRQCSSGLQAVHYIASAIQNGTIDIGIGAGNLIFNSFQALNP
jgi:acetyl-CoA acyltransferase 1